jgi:hypothetical protein
MQPAGSRRLAFGTDTGYRDLHIAHVLETLGRIFPEALRRRYPPRAEGALASE